jgi:hypothetical protein
MQGVLFDRHKQNFIPLAKQLALPARVKRHWNLSSNFGDKTRQLHYHAFILCALCKQFIKTECLRETGSVTLLTEAAKQMLNVLRESNGVEGNVSQHTKQCVWASEIKTNWMWESSALWRWQRRPNWRGKSTIALLVTLWTYIMAFWQRLIHGISPLRVFKHKSRLNPNEGILKVVPDVSLLLISSMSSRRKGE